MSPELKLEGSEFGGHLSIRYRKLESRLSSIKAVFNHLGVPYGTTIDFPGYVAQLVNEGLPIELATTSALEGFRTNLLFFERLASFIPTPGSLSRPTVIVAAAGNESRMDENPNFAIAVSPPAVSEGIISVAALGKGSQGLTIAPYSNTGATISGPGVGIVSATPGGGLGTKSGTSMATPHVAGVAALWAERLKKSGRLTHGDLSARLIASGQTGKLQSGFNPNDAGAGLVNAPAN